MSCKLNDGLVNWCPNLLVNKVFNYEIQYAYFLKQTNKQTNKKTFINNLLVCKAIICVFLDIFTHTDNIFFL